MILKWWNARRFALVMSLVALIAVSCSSGDPEPTATPDGPGDVPLFFPYVFSGNFTVAGEPGPEGIPMFARLGDGRGPFNNTIRAGEYINISIAPVSADAIGGEITFFLGHPDGDSVQAEETYVYNRIAQPQFIDLDLSFPRLP